MSCYNIYFSPTGGTKKVADILIQALAERYQEVDLCRDIAPMTLTPEDICLISVPSYCGRVPAIALERLRAISANGAKAVLVCVYGNREWEDTLTELQDTLESIGFVCAAAVAAVAEHSIFRQFATGRPDEEDAGELVGFAEKIRRKLEAGRFGPLNLAGNHGTYLEHKGILFQPEGNESCVKCGICADGCPVGAIDRDNPRATDKNVCIGCMRCLGLCPRHARDFSASVMKEAALVMEPKLSGHKENHLFLG